MRKDCLSIILVVLISFGSRGQKKEDFTKIYGYFEIKVHNVPTQRFTDSVVKMEAMNARE